MARASGVPSVGTCRRLLPIGRRCFVLIHTGTFPEHLPCVCPVPGAQALRSSADLTGKGQGQKTGAATTVAAALSRTSMCCFPIPTDVQKFSSGDGGLPVASTRAGSVLLPPARPWPRNLWTSTRPDLAAFPIPASFSVRVRSWGGSRAHPAPPPPLWPRP